MMRAWVKRLVRDKSAVAAVEFALAAPLALTLLFGVLQIGLAMQAYNAMRGAAGEIGRYVVVQYMSNNKLQDSAIQTQAVSKATAAPFYLKGTNLDITATTGVTTLVGVKKITLTMSYDVPDVLPFLPFSPTLTLTKDIYAYNPA
jgi:Flp pilus assembly protein TadG